MSELELDDSIGVVPGMSQVCVDRLFFVKQSILFMTFEFEQFHCNWFLIREPVNKILFWLDFINIKKRNVYTFLCRCFLFINDSLMITYPAHEQVITEVFVF